MLNYDRTQQFQDHVGRCFGADVVTISNSGTFAVLQLELPLQLLLQTLVVLIHEIHCYFAITADITSKRQFLCCCCW
jgi:hypothetical protein